LPKKIEKLIDAKNIKQLTNPKLLGRVKRLEDGNDRYIKILKKNFPKNFNLNIKALETRDFTAIVAAIFFTIIFLIGIIWSFWRSYKVDNVLKEVVTEA